jgi:hypothetical protein
MTTTKIIPYVNYLKELIALEPQSDSITEFFCDSF